MSRPIQGARLLLQSTAVVACLSMAGFSFAAAVVVDNTTISAVVVNGGADTSNPGTTCIQITNPVSPACSGGYIAIRNNNQHLLSAAMSNKTTGSRVRLMYVDAGTSNHCPFLVFTPCSVESIESK